MGFICGINFLKSILGLICGIIRGTNFKESFLEFIRGIYSFNVPRIVHRLLSSNILRQRLFDEFLASIQYFLKGKHDMFFER